MPLQKGRSKAAISANIRELSHSQTAAGKKRNAGPNAHARNVAIAMKTARPCRRTFRTQPEKMEPISAPAAGAA